MNKMPVCKGLCENIENIEKLCASWKSFKQKVKFKPNQTSLKCFTSHCPLFNLPFEMVNISMLSSFLDELSVYEILGEIG